MENKTVSISVKKLEKSLKESRFSGITLEKSFGNILWRKAYCKKRGERKKRKNRDDSFKIFWKRMRIHISESGWKKH